MTTPSWGISEAGRTSEAAGSPVARTPVERIRAARQAIVEVLTPHQRGVLVAISLNDVPIDVLAERRGTTRDALYRTLRSARRKLRADLA